MAVVAWLAVQPQFYAALGVVMPISIEGKGGHEALALLLFGLAAPVVLFLTGPLSNYWSRKHEFEADAFAAQTSSAKDLCDALVAMYRDNAATLTPHPWYSFIHDTHPSAPVRIAALNRLKPLTENVTS